MGPLDYYLANENSIQTTAFEAIKHGKINTLYTPHTISYLARYNLDETYEQNHIYVSKQLRLKPMQKDKRSLNVTD